MRSVGIKILKNRLSEYVRIAASGEEVLVTEHDRIVAELGPPRPERSPRIHDALLAEAVRNGWLKPPATKGIPLPPRKPVTTLRHVLRELREDRDAR